MDSHTKEHLHESPKTMTGPLVALGVLSIVGGYVGLPHIFGFVNKFEEFLSPVMKGLPTTGGHGAEHALASAGGSASMEWTLMGVTVVCVLIMIYLAYYFYIKNTKITNDLKNKFSGIHRLLENKYYVDEIYGAVIIRPLLNFSLFLWKIFDVMLIDGLINGMAALLKDISNIARKIQTGKIRTYATVFTAGVIIIIGYLMLK